MGAVTVHLMFIMSQTWMVVEFGQGSLDRAKSLDMGPGLHLRIGVECKRPGSKREDSPGKVRVQSVLAQLEIKGG